MSCSYPLPAQGNTVFDQPTDLRALLEEHWRRQVATITELSYAALTPEPDEQGVDTLRSCRLQLAARLIAAARHQLQETEAALAELRDGGDRHCGHCGAPMEGTRGERILGDALRRLPASALVPAAEERA